MWQILQRKLPLGVCSITRSVVSKIAQRHVYSAQPQLYPELRHKPISEDEDNLSVPLKAGKLSTHVSYIYII